MQRIFLNPSEPRLTGKYRSGEVLVFCDATDAAFSVQLPDAKGATDTVFFLFKSDSSVNAVTLATTNDQTINGASTDSLASQYSCIQLVSNNSNWAILSEV